MAAARANAGGGRRLRGAGWGVLRLLIAAFLLSAIASDTGARLARMQLASLPDFNYAGEIRYLRAAGRYGEAIMVADAGLEGAAAADMFIVGDVRDLLIQGSRYVMDGEADEVIVLLSSVGVATTLLPEVDWEPA